MNDNSKTILALLAGIAAGAALGLLFAPEKGTNTRDLLSDTLGRLSSSLKDAVTAELDQLAVLKERFVSAVKVRLDIAEEGLQDDLEHA